MIILIFYLEAELALIVLLLFSILCPRFREKSHDRDIMSHVKALNKCR